MDRGGGDGSGGGIAHLRRQGGFYDPERHANGSFSVPYQAGSRSGQPCEIHVAGQDEMYRNFESALLREAGDPLRYSYPTDHHGPDADWFAAIDD